MKSRMIAIVGVLILGVASAGAARGGAITFGLVQEFSGATPPEGTVPPPWLTVTIDDGTDDTDGVVTLTLAATNLTGSEKVMEWCLNLDPSFDPTNLVFSNAVKTGTFNDPTISTGADAYQADGDGLFDIEFAFDHTGGDSNNFGAGESIQYTVTLSGGGTLKAASFDFLGTPGGGHGPYPTAAHVLSIGSGEDSGWITTPEPATLVLLGLGTLGLVLWRKRK